jgi:DNA-binding transcriptional regulator YhcF (GntR family)
MGKLILVKKGSKITSIRQLAERWGWSKMKVSRFLDVLESDNMLIQKRDSKKTLITLIKYEDYQSSKSKGGTVKGHSRDTQKTLTGNRRETDGNKQDIKEGIIEDIIKKEEESEQKISDEQAREWGWID